MFLSSILISETYKINNDTGLYEATYLIKDDSFEEKVLGKSKLPTFLNDKDKNNVGVRAGYAVIKCYQDKNLNVARNFFEFLRFGTKVNRTTIRLQFQHQKRHNLLFKEIEKDLAKYLILV